MNTPLALLEHEEIVKSAFLSANITISGYILGIPIEPFILAAIAATVMLGINCVISPLKGFSQVILSALIAASLTPLGTLYISSYFHTKYNWEIDDVVTLSKTIIPILLGAFFQIIYPLAIEYIPKFLNVFLNKLGGGKT